VNQERRNRLRKEIHEERIQEEMREVSFKPKINKSSRENSQQRQLYELAVIKKERLNRLRKIQDQ
jgi:hypothetical protein